MARDLSLYMEWPRGAGAMRDASEQENKKWVDDMCSLIQRHEEVSYFESEFVTPDGTLHLNANRHGTAYSAIWGAGDPPEAVAITVFLQGIRGEDDSKALDAYRDLRSNAPPKTFAAIQAKNRPCVHVRWSDCNWFQNGHIAAAAMALASSIMAGAKGNVSFSLENEPSPEEIEEQRKVVDDIGDVFQILHDHMMKTGRFNYTVKASEKISGRPIQDIMEVKFWVGVNGQGRTLSAVALVNVFGMVATYVQQARGMKYMVKPTTKHMINLGLEPFEVEPVLKRIAIEEPQ